MWFYGLEDDFVCRCCSVPKDKTRFNINGKGYKLTRLLILDPALSCEKPPEKEWETWSSDERNDSWSFALAKCRSLAGMCCMYMAARFMLRLVDVVDGGENNGPSEA